MRSTTRVIAAAMTEIHKHVIKNPDVAIDKVILNRDGVKDGAKDRAKYGAKELSEIQMIIISEIQKPPSITTSELAQKIDVKFRTLQRYISQLQSLGILTREGGRKEGHWVIIKDRKTPIF